MHLLASLSTGLCLLLLCNAFPISQPTAKPCKPLVENSGWPVSGLIVYSVHRTAPFGSSVCFNVSDTNPGLEFDTSCRLSMTAGTGSKPEEAQGWHPCNDSRVSFLYQPGSLQLRRNYVDDCLDEASWSGGTFFGNADTHFQVTTTEDALVWTPSQQAGALVWCSTLETPCKIVRILDLTMI